jgi:hypothetical protein
MVGYYAEKEILFLSEAETGGKLGTSYLQDVRRVLHWHVD